jgi:hypothetical protein
LQALFKSRDRGDTRHIEGGSRIRVIAADVPGAWGLGGTHPRFRVYCEELSELAAIAGDADPATTYKLYSRDARDDDAMVADVLRRAADARVAI